MSAWGIQTSAEVRFFDFELNAVVINADVFGSTHKPGD